MDCSLENYKGETYLNQPYLEWRLRAATRKADTADADTYVSKVKKILNNAYGYRSSEHISKVIFNDPATIVFWEDGTKTVVKCEERDTFDPEKGLAMAIAKRFLGDKGNYYNTFRKWLSKTEQKKTRIVVGKVCDVKSASGGVYITADLTKEGSDYLDKMLDTPITMSFEFAKDNE